MASLGTKLAEAQESAGALQIAADERVARAAADALEQARSAQAEAAEVETLNRHDIVGNAASVYRGRGATRPNRPRK